MENSNKQISFTIDNIDPSNPVAVLNNSSETKIVDGLEWNIRVMRKHYDGGRLKLDIHIGCNEKCTDKLWLARTDIRILNKTAIGGRNTDKCHYYNYDFSNGNTNFRAECDLNSSTTQVKIEIEIFRSLPSLMEFDTNLEITYRGGQENNGSNSSAEQNKVIAVNKHALATFSNYFRNLFFGNWAERRQQQVEITSFTIKEETDFDIEAFIKMIYASMAMGWMMGGFEMLIGSTTTEDKNSKYKMAIKILKLSVKYDLPMIQNCCEEYFTSQSKDKNLPKMELLEEAENLGLQKLKERTLKSITALDFCENFGKNLEIHARLGKRTKEEVIKMVENTAKRVRGSIVVAKGGFVGFGTAASGSGWDQQGGAWDDDDTFGNNGFGSR